MELLNLIVSSPVTSKIFSGCLMYGAALLGAVLMYFFAAKNGLEGTIPRLQRLLPDRHEAFYFRVDFVLVILLGPIVGLICFTPTNAFQALAAGCGWVSALNVLAQQKDKPPTTPPAPPEGT
jgi:hypothetical protein